MKIRVLILAGLLPLIFLSNSCKTEIENRPNFIFFIYDDASWEHFGCYGDPAVKTPGTDKLAEEGVLFTNAYCAAPSCSPSRAAILTGQDIYRLEEGGLLWGHLEKKFKVLPDLLKEAGYLTGYILVNHTGQLIMRQIPFMPCLLVTATIFYETGMSGLGLLFGVITPQILKSF